MEFENVSEKVLWESRRIAAAFGVSEYERVFWPGDYRPFHFQSLGEALPKVAWAFKNEDYAEFIVLRWQEKSCCVAFDSFTGFWDIDFSEGIDLDLMARGLYRLGFETKENVEDVLSQLPELSAHEKLEMRLSLPREFWPHKWLDEISEE